MPRSTFAIVTAVAALWCTAASAQTINLWPGVAPGRNVDARRAHAERHAARHGDRQRR
jgi:hypothetical protein